MGLFSDIYNTVARFFRPQEEQGDASKSVATNRLKLVLMQDRTNLTPKILEQMRSELIDLLSRYVEMDKELLELNFEQEGEQVALMLSIPVIRAKDEEEIEAALRNSNNNEEACTDSDSESENDEDSLESSSDEECEQELNDSDTESINHVSTPEEMSNSSKQDNASEQKEECAN